MPSGHGDVAAGRRTFIAALTEGQPATESVPVGRPTATLPATSLSGPLRLRIAAGGQSSSGGTPIRVAVGEQFRVGIPYPPTPNSRPPFKIACAGGWMGGGGPCGTWSPSDGRRGSHAGPIPRRSLHRIGGTA